MTTVPHATQIQHAQAVLSLAATPFLNSCPQSETAFKEHDGCRPLPSHAREARPTAAKTASHLLLSTPLAKLFQWHHHTQWGIVILVWVLGSWKIQIALLPSSTLLPSQPFQSFPGCLSWVPVPADTNSIISNFLRQGRVNRQKSCTGNSPGKVGEVVQGQGMKSVADLS